MGTAEMGCRIIRQLYTVAGCLDRSLPVALDVSSAVSWPGRVAQSAKQVIIRIERKAEQDMLADQVCDEAAA
jgi:hypothetical protein